MAKKAPFDQYKITIDLHKHALRQGPGDEDETRLAVELSGLKDKSGLKVADIGCGCGAATLVLAEELDADITAVDLIPDFLKALDERATERGLTDQITTLNENMKDLAFHAEEFDAIWSEGAIYNIGFEAGIAGWKPFLKKGGILAVSELTWLTHDRPTELEIHWKSIYPEVATAAQKFAVLEKHGYALQGYFVLPEYCWLENYYHPMRKRFKTVLAVHNECEEAKSLIAAEESEMELYKKYRDYFGYGYYIAKKMSDW